MFSNNDVFLQWQFGLCWFFNWKTIKITDGERITCWVA